MLEALVLVNGTRGARPPGHECGRPEPNFRVVRARPPSATCRTTGVQDLLLCRTSGRLWRQPAEWCESFQRRMNGREQLPKRIGFRERDHDPPQRDLRSLENDDVSGRDADDRTDSSSGGGWGDQRSCVPGAGAVTTGARVASRRHCHHGQSLGTQSCGNPRRH